MRQITELIGFNLQEHALLATESRRVTEVLSTARQTRKVSFAENRTVWVLGVSQSCYYVWDTALGIDALTRMS